MVYGHHVLTATSTSTVLSTTARTPVATPESTVTTSAKTSGMAVEGVVFIALYTRNSSGDEIANVNFLYDDIVHAVKIQ